MVLHRAAELGNLEVLRLLVEQLQGSTADAKVWYNFFFSIVWLLCAIPRMFSDLNFWRVWDFFVPEFVQRGHQTVLNQEPQIQLGSSATLCLMVWRFMAGVLIFCSDENGGTVLHYACLGENDSAVAYLLSTFPELESAGDSAGKLSPSSINCQSWCLFRKPSDSLGVERRTFGYRQHAQDNC